jgi:alanine racemase
MTLNTRIHSLRWIDAGESVGYGGTWTADRRSLIATLPVGYADGYPRQANNGTPMRLRGQVVPLAGRVSMDLITADVTNVDNAQIGDEIELWGNEVRIERIAAFNGMSAYELLARIPKRLPRVRI